MTDSFFAAVSRGQTVCVRESKTCRVGNVIAVETGELGRNPTGPSGYNIGALDPGVDVIVRVVRRKLLVDALGIQHRPALS
jgi:hypothetical protein